MRFRRRHLAVASLVMVVPLPLAAQGEEARDTTLSVVAGQVVDHATGAPVADAVIELTPRGAGGAVERRLSDSGGAFRFDDIEPGEYVFTATSLGYRSTEDVLEVAAQSNVSVEVRLTAAAIALQPIIVETTRRLWFMDGFEERRADARRHTGFFTSEEILARHPKYITDVFRSVPGATLVSSMIGADVLRVDG
ncbi:MAG: carboxypeptidase-like regulatory domain-containing protein, partial [Gemmatimonadota bacterium]